MHRAKLNNQHFCSFDGQHYIEHGQFMREIDDADIAGLRLIWETSIADAFPGKTPFEKAKYNKPSTLYTKPWLQNKNAEFTDEQGQK